MLARPTSRNTTSIATAIPSMPSLSAVTVGAVSRRFSTDTAVTPLEDGRYAARIDPGWWIERGPNGGYVAASSCGP